MVKSNKLMKIAIAADHAGYRLKEAILQHLREKGHPVEDLGTGGEESTDYPDYAAAVARRVSTGAAERGILVCTTGIGMSIAANKVPGIRAALAANAESVELTRAHNDANVLAIGAKFTDNETAREYLRLFLETPFQGGTRHERRVAKIAQIEEEVLKEQVSNA